jgi:hypothetical protein
MMQKVFIIIVILQSKFIMEPVAVFDKSFLHSLNREEAAIFDVMFMSNITPLFFLETLADLEKEVHGGRTPEQVVGNLAAKTPRLRSYGNISHWTLCWNELLGIPVQMERKPVLFGRAVEIKEKTGVVYEISEEMQAISRWQKGDFLGVERKFAKGWRPFVESVPIFERFFLDDGRKLKLNNFSEVLQLALHFVRADGRRWKTLRLAMDDLAVPNEARPKILARWKEAGGPPLHRFAPYAAYVFTINIFYEIAQGAEMVSTRASNRIDLAYLYYLPFTELFISGDKLHKNIAPIFMDRQKFVWAPDLKSDLTALKLFYAAHPEIETQGLIRIASIPPLNGNFLVSRIYDELRPGWREEAIHPCAPVSKTGQQLKEQIDSLKKASSVGVGRPPWDRQGVPADAILFEREVPIRCGGFRFVPFGVEA